MKERQNLVFHGDEIMKESYSSVSRPSLMKKYDVPVEQLDYKYVRNCNDPKKLTKIAKILRSGEEGFYPDLEAFVLEKLSCVDPTNRLLHPQVPVILASDLNTNERSELEVSLSDWIQSINPLEVDRQDDCQIFEDGDSRMPPVRNSVVIQSNKLENGNTNEIPFLKTSNPERIKSWEYDRWDKYNVDEELTRMDLQDLKIEEQERISTTSTQINKEQQLSDDKIANVTKIIDSPRPCCSKSLSTMSKPPLVQELPSSSSNHESSGSKVEDGINTGNSKRRFKIFIDDINTGIL